jgi:outer membrane protein assembly factor BamD
MRAGVAALWIIAVLAMLAGCGGGITMKLYPTAEEQYREAMREYQKENYIKAVDGFQKVINNFSGASMVDSAQFHLAMAYYQQKEFYMAAAEFERVVNIYPGSPYVDDSQYMTGLCYFKSAPKNYGLDQEELSRSIEALTSFITDYPESELADDARSTLAQATERLAQKRYESGRLYFRLGNYAAADIYFQSVIDEQTNSEWAARALYYQGESAYKQGKLQEAQSKYSSFLVVYPEHKLSEKAKKKLAKIDETLAKSDENK